MWKFIVDLFRKAASPPPIPSTDREMAEAEADIELPESVKRARSMVGRGRYCLGAGGKKPNAADPFSDCAHPEVHSHEDAGRVFCDCSGFVCWSLGILRKNSDGSWNYTDSFEARAKKQGIPWSKAQPGDVVVYGAGKAIGHCGIVSETDATGPTKVVHCQASKTPAVIEGSPSFFKKKGAVIWRSGL